MGLQQLSRGGSILMMGLHQTDRGVATLRATASPTASIEESSATFRAMKRQG